MKNFSEIIFHHSIMFFFSIFNVHFACQIDLKYRIIKFFRFLIFQTKPALTHNRIDVKWRQREEWRDREQKEQNLLCIFLRDPLKSAERNVPTWMRKVLIMLINCKVVKKLVEWTNTHKNIHIWSHGWKIHDIPSTVRHLKKLTRLLFLSWWCKLERNFFAW